MDRKIKKIIDQLGVNITDADGMDSDGHYIPLINTIVLCCKLSEPARTLVLLHELGHACLHHDNRELYNLTTAMHNKMENEANLFMINKIVEARFKDSDFNLESFNYMNFLESYDLNLNYEPIVRDMIESYYYRLKVV